MAVKLLVVDDEDTIRNGISNYVRLHSDRVDKILTAANGQEAVDMIMLHQPQIMLLDIQMPLKDGIEVLREAERAGVLPITIILSGYDEFKYAQQAIRFGVKEYVLKPCRSTEILRLVDQSIDEIIGKEEKRTQKEQTDNRLVNRAAEYINEHYSENITLGDVANEIEISAGYLSSLFSEHMDCGFVDYLNQVRIEHACTYLKQNKLKVYEVAFRVGFRDEKYFSKVFKKITGMSPAEYKKTD